MSREGLPTIVEQRDERQINTYGNDDQQRTNNNQGDANGRDELLYNDSEPNESQENLPVIVEQQKDRVTNHDENDDQQRVSNEQQNENGRDLPKSEKRQTG